MQSYHTRTWIYLGTLTHALIEAAQNKYVALSEQEIQQLKEENKLYLERALQLGPKREDVHIEWAKIYMLNGEYEKAKEHAQFCSTTDVQIGACWWLLAIAEISLGNIEKGEAALIQAIERGSEITQIALLQLARAYTRAQEYQKVLEIYKKLIELNLKEPQYLAYLATAYFEIGEYAEARQTALRIIELNPELEAEVNKFLDTLP